jgi:hypothetical protein
MTVDEKKQVELLSLFHYIVGGITALFSCIPLLHVSMGVAIVSGKFFNGHRSEEAFPEMFGWMFIIMGSVFILLGWATAVCMFLVGKKLKQKKARIFCMAVAGVECMFMPFGTVLGVFTLIFLNKDSVKQAFSSGPAPLQE